MIILSLFDGISCGRVAAERANLQFSAYYRSEIDAAANTVAGSQFPDSVSLGSVEGWRSWDIEWSKVGLIIGGSPCQGFSLSGKQLAFDDPRSKLFFVFADILRHCHRFNPKVRFLLENVKMKTEFKEAIDDTLDTFGIPLNSGLVSAQRRVRLYWFNWILPCHPEDRGLHLGDVIDDTFAERLLLSETWLRRLERSQDIPKGFTAVDPLKACTMTARQYANWKGTFVSTPKGIRKLSPVECERLQNLPDGYTKAVSDPHRYRQLGNGWTVDMIAHILSFSGLPKKSFTGCLTKLEGELHDLTKLLRDSGIS